MRSTNNGSWIREANSVAVAESAPRVRVTSNDALSPVSAFNGPRTMSRDKPAASVSSVSADDGKKPVPTDKRLVQPPERKSAEIRGLMNVPYAL